VEVVGYEADEARISHFYKWERFKNHSTITRKHAIMLITRKHNYMIGGLIMNEKDIIREAMKSCGWNQEILAQKAGYKTQSAIGNKLKGKSMRVDTFVKLIATMGYEVMVRSTSPNTNKNKWVINYDSENKGIDSDELALNRG